MDDYNYPGFVTQAQVVKDLNQLSEDKEARMLIKANPYTLVYFGSLKLYVDNYLLDNPITVSSDSELMKNKILLNKMEQVAKLRIVEDFPIELADEDLSILALVSDYYVGSSPYYSLMIHTDDLKKIEIELEDYFDAVYYYNKGNDIIETILNFLKPDNKAFSIMISIVLLGITYVLNTLTFYKQDRINRRIKYYFGQTRISYLIENITRQGVLVSLGLLCSVLAIYLIFPRVIVIFDFYYFLNTILIALAFILSVNLISLFTYSVEK